MISMNKHYHSCNSLSPEDELHVEKSWELMQNVISPNLCQPKLSFDNFGEWQQNEKDFGRGQNTNLIWDACELQGHISPLLKCQHLSLTQLLTYYFGSGYWQLCGTNSKSSQCTQTDVCLTPGYADKHLTTHQSP